MWEQIMLYVVFKYACTIEKKKKVLERNTVEIKQPEEIKVHAGRK